MCGTVGLFADCPLAQTCAISQLARAGSAADPAPEPFRSPFEPWYERSAVRGAPRRVLAPVDRTQAMFSPDLVPLLQDERVRARGEDVVRRATIHQALRYLEFTSVLEARVVNDVVRDIMFLEAGVALPQTMVRDAHRIYTDEAYHAQFSFELAAQISELTGVQHDRSVVPYFIRRLRRIKTGLEPSLHRLVDHLFVFVSETLITGSLSAAAQDPRVALAVRETMRDHARDEGRHHSYFAAYFARLWAALPAEVRVQIGPVVPDLIDAFLAPDVTLASVELASYGFDVDEADDIIAGVVRRAHGGAGRTRMAARTLQYLREAGADEIDSATTARYEEMGMGRS